MKDIKKRLLAVCDRLSALYRDVETLKGKINDLEKLGIIGARLHWPKDKPGALELLYTTNSEYTKKTGRRRQYIGKDEEKQQEAMASIERWRQRRELSKQLQHTWQAIASIERKIDDLVTFSERW